MYIKRGLKKCVDEMNIPKAESVMPEGVNTSEKRDAKKSVHRRYVSYACAGIAVAAAVAVCVFVWQPWKEVSDYDLYVGNAMDDATPTDESLMTDAESTLADGSELFSVAVTDESMSEEEISELEDIENEDKKDLDESVSAETGASTEGEAEKSSTGYPNGQEQEIYAYYNDALYYYNLGTTTILPDDAVNVGVAIITTELPDSNLEVSCMPEGTEIYYSESKDKIYLTTDGEEYWILSCMG